MTNYTGTRRMRYELPRSGTSLTGYIVRRLHKTQLLIDTNVHPHRLGRVGVYALASAGSWGPAYYQPRFDSPGTRITEEDPATSAHIEVVCTATSPHYAFTYTVEMPNGARFRGEETITGTTLSLRGLGMPAPSTFTYEDGDYQAEAVGTITSELVPRLLFTSKIRAYGQLQVSDNEGHSGTVRVDRKGRMTITLDGSERNYDLT